jgi:hypothetical protein
LTATRIAARAAVALVVASWLTACGGGGSDGASSQSQTVTTAAGASQFPFDSTSAKQFPGTSLDQRLTMAQQVCDSIRSHGDNYVTWLSLSNTRNDLVPFAADHQTLVAFSGLAVKGVCPGYLPQLQSALGGS